MKFVSPAFRRSVDTELFQQEPTWHSEYSHWITLYEPRFECPPNVQVNLGAESSIGHWNLLPHVRPKQGNDNLLFGTHSWKPWKTLNEPAQPKSDIVRLPSAWNRPRFLACQYDRFQWQKFKEYFGTAQTSR